MTALENFADELDRWVPIALAVVLGLRELVGFARDLAEQVTRW